MPKRDPQHMRARRERILRATIRCIGELGLERTSVAEIRREAGMSAGAIYTHFVGKEQIVAEALRFAAMSDAMLPDDWTETKAALSSADDQMGFDITTIARAKLQLYSSAIRPGPLRDMLKPMIDATLAVAVRHLEEMADAGKIRLRMSPTQTAMCISALADGLIWIGLADNQPWSRIAETIDAGLNCLVEPSEDQAAPVPPL